jgi:pyridoxine 4-dehydrogenase
MTIVEICHSSRYVPVTSLATENMKRRTLGTAGPEVSTIGLGCMGMSDLYGPADLVESIATIHAALDAGINLIDSGDFYGMGHNELLIHEALATVRRDQVVLSVKFGAQRAPDGSWLGYDARPQAVKTALAYTLRRLGTDYVDVYRPARVDPAVPIEDTVGAIADMIHAGYVRHLGLSEASAATVRRAHAVHPVTDLQIEYSIISRGIESEILSATRDLGVGVTAYGVLSRGLLSEHATEAARSGGFRSILPRFQGANLEHNLGLVESLRLIASEKGITVPQLAIAWVLSRGSDIVPLIGARRRARLAESLRALDLHLSAEDLSRIEEAVPPGAVAGDRYASSQMVMLDSERAGVN